MQEWIRQVQNIIDEIESSIKRRDLESATLFSLAHRLGYSESHMARKFKEISGMTLGEYLRLRKLAYALTEVRDTRRGLVDIALDYGFSSHEAFTRAFREAYGMTPSEYRENPRPVVLRTILRPWDCFLLERPAEYAAAGEGRVRTYFVTVPAHKYLHIRNYESVGYWDFWQKQSVIPGQDCETICGLLASIPGKLDDLGDNENNAGSGQLMAFINEPEGRICSWGIPLAESYGARLPVDWQGEVPPQMQLMDVPEGEYIVFEHGPFDFERENTLVERRIEQAMKTFDYASSGYALDTAQGRVFYFYHDVRRGWKYVRPVKKV